VVAEVRRTPSSIRCIISGVIERPSRLIRADASSIASGALLSAMLASAAVLLYAGRDQTIREEALGYAARLASEPLGHALLHSPPNKYLIAFPLLLYGGMFNAFGLGADLPYRLLVTALVLLCGGLFFVLARRRVGDLMALAPTGLLLFFGSGWETLITVQRIPSLLAVATGLGALIALERRDRPAEISAAVLLSASVASHPVGLAFLTAAGVIVLLGGPRRGWRRVWVLGPALAIFGGWWLFLRTTTPSITPTTAKDIVTFVVQSWTTITADVTGLAGVVGHPSFHQTPAQILAAALLGIAMVIVLPRLPRVPPTLWAAVAGLIVLFASTRLSPQGFFRHPDDVRYLYPAAVLFLWLLIEVLGLVDTRGPIAAAAVFVVLGLGLAYNLARLSDGSKLTRFSSAAARGQYAASELAGGKVDRSYRVAPIGYPSAGDYLAAAGTYGSAAEPVGELSTASVTTRQALDQALAGSLNIRLQAVRWDPSRAGNRPKVKRILSGRSSRVGNCLRLVPEKPAPGMPSVPDLAELGPLGGGIVFRARRIGGVAARVGTFAAPPSAQLGRLQLGNAALLRLPAGSLSRPWDVTLAADQTITVCTIG
jgi:hypothetical protein